MIAVLLCLIGCYLIEVVCGSSPATSNPEIGCETDFSEPSRLTNKQFFLQFLPIIASMAGLLSLLAHFQQCMPACAH
jgi:hypothetical protein